MNAVKIIFLSVIIVAVTIFPATAGEYPVYFGTFTDKSSKGIYVSHLNSDSGKLSPPELAAEIPNPSFLAASPDGKFLYAAIRSENTNAVGAFAIAPGSGRLKLIDEKPSGGNGPCHVSVDAAGHAVFVANYSGGSIKSFHLGPAGRLADGTFIQHHGGSVNTNRQNAAHAHFICADPTGRFVLACDLGLDKVMIYRLDPKKNAALTANTPPSASVPPGAGARHLAFNSDGKSAYVVNEMACSVTSFLWDATNGVLAGRENISLLPVGATLSDKFTAAEIAVRPDGRFIYATVRGHDSVSVLAVATNTGNLSLIQNISCGGKIPRGMGIDSAGRWLLVANQKSDSVAVFAVDATTGRLAPTGQTVHVGSPVDVEFAPHLR